MNQTTSPSQTEDSHVLPDAGIPGTINYMEAPLVHLVDTDPSKLTPEQLHQYINTLRVMQGSAATAKAATRRGSAPAASRAKSNGIDLGGLL